MIRDRKKRITIIVHYNSGRSMQFTCENFSIEKTQFSTTVTWKHALPEPLMFNIDAVESIWCSDPNWLRTDGAVV